MAVTVLNAVAVGQFLIALRTAQGAVMAGSAALAIALHVLSLYLLGRLEAEK